jgi:hypothetical protein
VIDASSLFTPTPGRLSGVGSGSILAAVIIAVLLAILMGVAFIVLTLGTFP